MGWIPEPHDEDHAARHSKGDADEIDAADLSSGGAADGQVLTADGVGGAAWEDSTGGGAGGAAYAETIGDGVATSYQITHGLGSQDLVVQLWDLTGAEPIEATGDASQIEVDDDNNITVTFGSAPATDAYRVVVLASGGTASGGGGGSGGTFFYAAKPSTDDPPDDEFNDSSGMSGAVNGLDGKWTAVEGSEAAVVFVETGTVARYDLDTVPGRLLTQVGPVGQQVALRQDWTLGDGEGLVVAFTPAVAPVWGNNNIWVGFTLNNNDAGPRSGNYVSAHVENDGDPSLYLYTGVALYNHGLFNVAPVAIRVQRVGTAYHFYVSHDGEAWNPMGGPSGTVYDNLWLYMVSDSTWTGIRPIAAFHWVRKATDDFDPWDWR